MMRNQFRKKKVTVVPSPFPPYHIDNITKQEENVEICQNTTKSRSVFLKKY